jgi:hypothetical protein
MRSEGGVAVSWTDARDPIPAETKTVLSKWLQITEEGVVMLQSEHFDYQKYQL